MDGKTLGNLTLFQLNYIYAEDSKTLPVGLYVHVQDIQ